jgi:hypothetical protein
MQTVVWMAYSNSMHFSDKLSYKILCFSSYRLRDMNFARFEGLQEFLFENRKTGDLFSPKELSPGR